MKRLVSVANVFGAKLEANYAVTYWEVPLITTYKTDVGFGKLNIFAGPYFATALSGKIKTTGLGESVEEDLSFGTGDNDDIKGSDYGLNIGAGVEIDKISIRLQYQIGLNNLDPDNDTDYSVYNRVFGLSLGYMF